MLSSLINDNNKHKALRYISNNIVEKLVNDNEIIWKLLKYQDPDALNKENLTTQEKRDLIYKGWHYRDNELVLDEMNDKAVFRQPWIDDADTKQSTMLRIYLSSLLPNNKLWHCIRLKLSVTIKVSLLSVI